MFIGRKSEELNLKIACYGPALSGKTANLGNIHTSVDPRLPGEPVSLETQEDRTLFVDSLRLEAGLIRGLDPKSRLCVVPSQVIDAAARRLVLAGTSGGVLWRTLCRWILVRSRGSRGLVLCVAERGPSVLEHYGVTACNP